MPIFKIVGNLIAALGLLCGLFLLLSPITALSAYGLLLSGKMLALALLFILLSAIGAVLAGFGAGSKAAIDGVLFRIGSAWLLLGVLAILALVVDLVGVIKADITVVWWLMAAGCSVVGAIAVMMGSGAKSDGTAT